MPSAPDDPIAPPPAAALSTGPLVEVWLEVAAAESELAAAILERVAPAGVAIALPFKQDPDCGEAALSPQGRARVSCYLPASSWPELRPTVAALVAATPWLGAPAQVRATPLPDRDWSTAWHAHVQVQRFGRLVLRPTPCDYAKRADEVVVHLEPGLAFGSGSHESTRLALIALERWLQPAASALDLGTGSGVLACAAARLGASHVDAVDIDPLAVAAARRNARLNGVEGGLVAVQFGDRPPPDGSYDFVVANLTAPALVALADALTRATRPGGICVVAGVIDRQEARVARALRAAGLEPQETLREGEWRAIQSVRPAAGRRHPSQGPESPIAKSGSSAPSGSGIS